MIKYLFKTESDFIKAIQEVKDKNIKVTYKNIKPFIFPCQIPIDQIWKGEGKDRKIAEVQIYNREDFIKEKFNVDDLLYSEVEFVSETDGNIVSTFQFGKAFIKGIRYKEDSKGYLIDEIDYLYINYIPIKQTGDEFADEVDRVVGGIWKNKLYPKDILKITKKHKPIECKLTEPVF